MNPFDSMIRSGKVVVLESQEEAAGLLGVKGGGTVYIASYGGTDVGLRFDTEEEAWQELKYSAENDVSESTKVACL